MKRHPTLILFLLGGLTVVSPFSIDMYLPAFGQIATHFGTTPERVAFSLASYFVGLSLGQVFYGPLLDRFGRKPPLYAGLVVYILASIACAYAPSVEGLIFLRLMQALGGCVAQVASMAMIRDFFPASDRARVFSRLMLILSVSPFFAPTVGGWVVATYGWQAVFLSLAFVVSLILAMAFFFLPEGHTPDPEVSLSPAGIYTNLKSVLVHPTFTKYAVAGAFSFAGLFAYLGGSSPLFMGTFHLNPKEFGLVFALLSVGMIGAGQVSVPLTKIYSSAKVFQYALYAQLVFAFLFLGCALAGLGLYAHMIILLGYISCVGLSMPNSSALALEPFERNAGTAASMLGFLQMSIGALASAIFGALNYSPAISIAILFVASSIIGFFILNKSGAKTARSLRA